MDKKLSALIAFVLCLSLSLQAFASQVDFASESGTLTLSKVYNGEIIETKTEEDIKGEVQLTVTDTVTTDDGEKDFSYFQYVTESGETSIASYDNPFNFYSTGNMTVYAVYGDSTETEKSNGFFKDSTNDGSNIYYYINTLGDFVGRAVKNAYDKIYSVTDNSGYEVSSSPSYGQYIIGIPADYTTNKWTFNTDSFKDLGTISSTTTVDGLTLAATSSKTMAISSSSVTLGDDSYTYCLALSGSGSITSRAAAFAVSAGETINVVLKSTSTTEARTLNIADESGNVLGTVSAETSVSKGSFEISDYTGTVYLYSAGSGINIYEISVSAENSAEFTECTSEETTEETTMSIEVSDFSSLTDAISTIESNGGGAVYVTDDIDCTAQVALSNVNTGDVSIIGVQKSDGTYPILDFKTYRNSVIGSTGESITSSSDNSVGVRISGSNYTVKNLIIQKAGDNGIQIKGSDANYNTIENCIVRYNNDAGVQITNGASYNTLRFVYSYRNCDIYTIGGNSDGYAPKLGAKTGNTFYGCYAWDNSDDGWDSYDKENTDDMYTYDLSYEECACWNNGNPEIFTGKYDFDNSNALDEDLYLIELIEAYDSSFASNYSGGSFSLPTDAFINTEDGVLSASDWAGDNYAGNDNGFKFGSAYTLSESTRTAKNCVSFNHGTKGFDNNNSSCVASFENCISFDNGYNYSNFSGYTITGWENVYGFNGTNSDNLPDGYSAAVPSDSEQETIREKVEATRAEIVEKCQNDIIPGETLFDIYS